MSDKTDRRVWIIAAACTCGPLMSGLDATMMNVSLNTIGRAFHAPLGMVPFALGGGDIPLAVLAGALLVRGLGVGSITLPSAAAAYASVPREPLGHATTAINICQRFSGPVGTMGLAILLQHELAVAAAAMDAYAWTFWLLAGLAAAAVLAASQLPGVRSRA